MPRADAAPSVADQLLAMPHRPPNLRMEPFVHGKSRYWKVSAKERDMLRAQRREA